MLRTEIHWRDLKFTDTTADKAVQSRKQQSRIATKLHLALTAENHVVEGILTGGNVWDITVSDELMADVVGFYGVEDAGYDRHMHRRLLDSNNNIPVIPGRKKRKIQIVYDHTLYKLPSYSEIFF